MVVNVRLSITGISYKIFLPVRGICVYRGRNIDRAGLFPDAAWGWISNSIPRVPDPHESGSNAVGPFVESSDTDEYDFEDDNPSPDIFNEDWIQPSIQTARQFPVFTTPEPRSASTSIELAAVAPDPLPPARVDEPSAPTPVPTAVSDRIETPLPPTRVHVEQPPPTYASAPSQVIDESTPPQASCRATRPRYLRSTEIITQTNDGASITSGHYYVIQDSRFVETDYT